MSNETNDEGRLLHPWQVRKDWAAGEIRSVDAKGVKDAWTFALVVNALVLPVGILLPGKIQETGNPMLYTALAFPLLGLIIVLTAIRTTLRFRKFGSAIFKMLSVPGQIGGTLSGVVQTGTKLVPKDGFHLSLRCRRRVVSGSRKSRRVDDQVLWEDKKVVNQMPIDGLQSAIPVCFNIPSRCSATSNVQGISWMLVVEATFAGVTFQTRFEVPVFETSLVAARQIDSEEFAARYEIPIDFVGQLSAVGIKVQSTPAKTEIVFVPARNNGIGIFALFLLLIALAGLVFAIQGRSSFGILVSLVFTAAFVYLCSQLWLKLSRVTADASGLTVETRYPGRVKSRVLNPKNISVIEVASDSQLGNQVYYSIVAWAPDKIELGDGISGRKEADWIVEKLYSALNLPRTHEAAQNLEN